MTLDEIQGFHTTATIISKDQYIGLIDKNGKEIYENDILQLSYMDLSMDGYVKAKDDGEWIFYKDKDNFLGVHHNLGRIEIIGNIYETPELVTRN